MNLLGDDVDAGFGHDVSLIGEGFGLRLGEKLLLGHGFADPHKPSGVALLLHVSWRASI